MNWRLAHSLETCRSQANIFAPHRSTASDGTIGDVSHASGPSGHNPDANGVVTSLDLTQDPNGGLDVHKWIRLVIAQPSLIPDDLHYAISNRRIFNRDYNWLDRPYGGSDPHTGHIHLSVGRGSDPVVGGGPVGQPYDNLPNWHFDLLTTPIPTPPPSPIHLPAPSEASMYIIHNNIAYLLHDGKMLRLGDAHEVAPGVPQITLVDADFASATKQWPIMNP